MYVSKHIFISDKGLFIFFSFKQTDASSSAECSDTGPWGLREEQVGVYLQILLQQVW